MVDEYSPDCFVDTNIWLFAFIESDDKAKSASARNLLHQSQPVMSVQVVNEVCVNMIKKANVAEELIRQLVASFYANYRVLDLDQTTLLSASELRERYSLSF